MSDKVKDTDKSNSELATWHQRLSAGTMLTPAGIFNHLYGSQVRAGMRDFLAQTAESVISLVDTDAGEKAGDWLQNAWNKVAVYEDGKFDFRFAKGWKMPEGMKYNGKLPSEPGYEGPKPGEKIDTLLSAFYRRKDGTVEVIDRKNSEFFHIVGPYAATQATLMATVGTKGVTKLKETLALTQGFTAKAGAAAYLTIASADMWGGGVSMAKVVGHNFILKPEAIDRFARLIEKPERLTLGQMRDDLNIILEQYSRKSGSKTEQYYIPPLSSNQGVLTLLDEMSKGRVKGYVRSQPFAEIPDGAKRENVHIGNIREVSDNPYFRSSFLRLATKALEGKPLSQSEQLALRFGMNIAFDQKNLSLAGSGKDQASFTTEDYQQTLRALRDGLSEPLLRQRLVNQYTQENRDLAPDAVVDKVDQTMQAWNTHKRPPLPDADLLKFAAEKQTKASAEITELERPKNPIIHNRIDSPFVLG